MMADDESSWSLETPFWIDTDGYTDRDREMFVCGVEFEMIVQQINKGKSFTRTIHTENASRVRLLCGKANRQCDIRESEVEGWSFLEVQ